MSELSAERILKEVRFFTFTSGGPGGQHANRTLSAVRAVHLPTGITAIARDSRSQLRNKELALERLLAKLKERRRPLKPRIATAPTVHSRLQRRKLKEQRAQTKLLRRKVEME